MNNTVQHNKFYPVQLPGFKRCGGLVVAQTKDRLTFLKRRAAIGRYVDDGFSYHQTFKVINRGTQRQFLENICSEDDLRFRIFGTVVVKFLTCLPLLGFSNI